MDEHEIDTIFANLTAEERRSWEVLIGSKVPPYTDESEAARTAWRMAKEIKKIILTTANTKLIRQKLLDYRQGERQFWMKWAERHPHDQGVINLRLAALDRMLGVAGGAK